MNLRRIKLNKEVLVVSRNKTFSNSLLGETSFFTGGAAREVAFHYLANNEMPDLVRVRDIDVLLGGVTPELEGLLDESYVDYREVYNYINEETPQDSCSIAEQAMQVMQVDVNINQCLLGKHFLWISSALIEGWLKKEVSLTWDSNGKEAIRAHFFAFRYGFATKANLPLVDSYYLVAERKAEQLGLSLEWEAYLADKPKVKPEEDEEIQVELVLDDGAILVVEEKKQ